MNEEDFESIVEGLEDIEELDDVIDYTEMSKIELAVLIAGIKEEMSDRRETIYPRTERGRELHSQYTAAMAALRKKQGHA